CFFFFQAEDGIRDRNVTGVQTCALPIFAAAMERTGLPAFLVQTKNGIRAAWGEPDDTTAAWTQSPGVIGSNLARLKLSGFDGPRSEERRVGTECRSRGGRTSYKKRRVTV